MSTESDIAKMTAMKRRLSGAKVRKSAGSPLSRRNLRTLFQSATGRFPARRHR